METGYNIDTAEILFRRGVDAMNKLFMEQRAIIEAQARKIQELSDAKQKKPEAVSPKKA